MLKRQKPPVHPGIILREDVIKEYGLTITDAAKMLGVAPGGFIGCFEWQGGNQCRNGFPDYRLCPYHLPYFVLSRRGIEICPTILQNLPS